MLQWTQAVVVHYASVDTGSCGALRFSGHRQFVVLYASVDTGSCDALRYSGHRWLWCFMLHWTQAVVMLYATVNTGAAPEGQQNTQHLPN